MWFVRAGALAVAALMDASVGSTAFLLQQFLGHRARRASLHLRTNYEMDVPAAVDRLDAEAAEFARSADLAAWLRDQEW